MWIVCNCIICSRILLHLFVSKTKWTNANFWEAQSSQADNKSACYMSGFLFEWVYLGIPTSEDGAIFISLSRQAPSIITAFILGDSIWKDGSFQHSSLRISGLHNHLKQAEYLFSSMRRFYFILFFVEPKLFFLMFDKIYS